MILFEKIETGTMYIFYKVIGPHKNKAGGKKVSLSNLKSLSLLILQKFLW